MSEWTDAQLEAGIANALQAHNMEAVVDILRVLASQNPQRAAQVLATLELGISLKQPPR